MTVSEDEDGSTVATIGGAVVARATVVDDRARRRSTRSRPTRPAPPWRRTPGWPRTRSRPASPAAPTAPRATGCGSSPAGSADQDGATRIAATWTPHPSVGEDFHAYVDELPARLAGRHLGGARLHRRLGRRPHRAADGARRDDRPRRRAAGDRRGARRRRAGPRPATAARPSPPRRSTTPTAASSPAPSTSGSPSTPPRSPDAARRRIRQSGRPKLTAPGGARNT